MMDYTTRPDPSEPRYQQKRERLADLQRRQRAGERFLDEPIRQAEEQIGFDERNHAAFEARMAQQQAQQDTQAAQRAATRDAEAAQAVADLKARMRAAFVGTAADFERQWPNLLAEWQRQQALQAVNQDDLIARKRDMLRGF